MKTRQKKLAEQILDAATKQSPYKDTDARKHYHYVLGFLAGSLAQALDSDSKLLKDFIRKLK